MHVAHRQVDLNRNKSIDGGARGRKNPVIERVFESMILRLHASSSHARRNRGTIENRREIETPRLPMIDGGVEVEHVNAPHHLIDAAETQLRHILAHLFGKKEKEI